MNNIKTSVVMTTYNGEKYLVEQLKSLRDQLLPFDEIIILDDCSTDDSPKIIKDFIDSNHLTSWKLIRNATNQGWKKNFKNGFDIAKGDYIFPCDQDDIWHLEKCQEMIDIMDHHPNIEVLVSNYNIFFSEEDNGSNSYKNNSKKWNESGDLELSGIDRHWAYINRPGCTFCFRKSFYDDIKESWNVEFAHDAILWRYAKIRHSLAIYNKALIDFRRHGNNATSIHKRNTESTIKTFDSYLFFCGEALKSIKNPKERKIIEDNISFLQLRKKVYSEKDILAFIKVLTKYKRFYLSYRGILGDIYYCFVGGH